MIDWVYAKLTGRSKEWRACRKAFLSEADNKHCAACDRKRGLEVHHIIPFDLRPDLELKPYNLLTLCSQCHFIFGHFADYRSYNPGVVDDCRWYRIKRLAGKKKIV